MTAITLRFPFAICMAAILAAGSAAWSGCAHREPAVELSGTWPENPDAYTEAYRTWTRRGVVRDGFQQVLEVYATFKSPAYRAAYVKHRTQRLRLGAEAQTELKEVELAQAAQGPYEVQLLVTTYNFRENDLQRGDRSVWRVALVDAQGNQVEPIEIVRDRRPLDVLRVEYPDMGDFATAYVARFPRDINLFGEGAARVSLIIASARGAVELNWRAR